MPDVSDAAVANGATAVARDPLSALVAALAEAQATFPTVEKRHTADVRGKDGKPGYRYTYADLGDVLTAVRPVLARHGLTISQPTRRTERGFALVTELRHVDGGILTSDVDLGQSPGNPQQFGGALTYLRRYELCTLLGIAAEEDRDAQDVEPQRIGNGAGAAPAPAPPPWAQPTANLAPTRDALVGLVGVDEADAILNGVAGMADGAIPRVVATTLRALCKRLDDVERVNGAVAEPPADGDPPPAPAEEPAAAPTSGGRPLNLETAPFDDVALAADDHPDAEIRAAAAAELARRSLRDVPETGPPPAGSVQADDLPADPAKATAVLKRLGCVCGDPLGVRGAKSFNDTCPIAGHGIPF